MRVGRIEIRPYTEGEYVTFFTLPFMPTTLLDAHAGGDRIIWADLLADPDVEAEPVRYRTSRGAEITMRIRKRIRVRAFWDDESGRTLAGLAYGKFPVRVLFTTDAGTHEIERAFVSILREPSEIDEGILEIVVEELP
ncbi:MAG: hypothetical protein QXT77_01010 [Candidatus Methanomethylicaceae archaeon]